MPSGSTPLSCENVTTRIHIQAMVPRAPFDFGRGALDFAGASAVTTTRSRKGGRSEPTSARRPPGQHPAGHIHARASSFRRLLGERGRRRAPGGLTLPCARRRSPFFDQSHQAITSRATSCARRRPCTRCTTHHVRTDVLFPCRPRQALCIRNTARTTVGFGLGSSLDLSIVAPPRSGTLRPAIVCTEPEAQCQGCEAPSEARLALDTEGLRARPGDDRSRTIGASEASTRSWSLL